MDLDYADDPIAAEIAAHLVLARWAKYDTDPDLRDDQRLAMIAGDVRALTDTAAALRAIASEVAAGSSTEAVAARVAAGEATAKAEERRFRTGARAVERRIDLRKAAERVERERRELSWREEAFARLEKSDAPSGEILISEGAVLMARQRVEEAERALAAAQSRM